MAGDKCWCDDRSSAFCNVECRHIDEHRRYKAALEEIAHLNVVGGDEAALIAREVLATNQHHEGRIGLPPLEECPLCGSRSVNCPLVGPGCPYDDETAATNQTRQSQGDA